MGQLQGAKCSVRSWGLVVDYHGPSYLGVKTQVAAPCPRVSGSEVGQRMYIFKFPVNAIVPGWETTLI